MAAHALPIRILLVRSWLRELRPLGEALQTVGFAPSFIHVDIEPALYAALERGGFDIVLFDPDLRTIPRDVAETMCKQQAPGVPFVVLGALEDLGAQIAAVLDTRWN